MDKLLGSLCVVGAAFCVAPVVGLAAAVVGAAWPVVPLLAGAGAAAHIAANSNNRKEEK